MGWARRVAGSLCVCGVVAAGAFLIGECVLRRLPGIGSSGIQEKVEFLRNIENSGSQVEDRICAHDDDLGMRYVPGTRQRVVTSEFDVTYSINAHGLRDAEHEYAKKGGVFRIIVLGDSYIFGEGIPYGERITEVLAQKLKNTEVINMGVQAFGFDQSLLLLEKEGLKYNPDLVVVFVHRPNLERCGLFFSSVYKPRFELDQAQTALVLKRPYEESGASGASASAAGQDAAPRADATPQRSVFEKSAIFSLVQYRLYKKKVERELQSRDRAFWEANNKKFSEGNQGAITGSALEKTVCLLFDRCRNLCAAGGARLLVINMDVGPLSSVDTCLKARGIPYYDLSGILSQPVHREKIYFKISPHFNAYGNRFVGEQVAAYVGASGLVPEQ